MNLKQALYITTIAKEGSITAAARRLHVSQPSLSQMLRLIEGELGVPLFERVPFQPTYAGKRYLHAAAIMLSTNEDLNNELQEIRQGGSGRLRLGISRQRAAHILPAVLPRFTREYPNVTIELQESGSAALERMLQEEKLDLAFVSTKPGIPCLEYHLVQREVIGILAGRDSPLAQRLPSGTPIRLEEMGAGPFVVMEEGHNVRIIQDRLFRAHGLQPAVYLETGNMETAVRVARTGACYMLCPAAYADPGSVFYPLVGCGDLRHFYACLRQGQTMPKFMSRFLELVRECVEEGG